MVSEFCLGEALINAAKEVFETMIFMELEESFDAEQKIEGDALLGLITFLGTYPPHSEGVCTNNVINNVEGVATICMNIQCAKAVAINMLGMDDSEDLSETEICDAIGEVTNMVMGSVKSRIQDNISNIAVSVPTVTTGYELCYRPGEGSSKVLTKVNIDDKYMTELSLSYRLRAQNGNQ